jgi:hypothetical protein
MRAVVIAAMTALFAVGGCLLGTSFDGLSSGAPIDASVSDATTDAAISTPPSDDAPSPPDAPDAPLITFVQTNATNSDDPVSSLDVGFVSDVTAHNTLIVSFRFSPASITMMSITDSLGNTFTPVDSVVVDADAGGGLGVGLTIYMFAAFDVIGGHDTITVAPSTPAPTAVLAFEYANIGSFDTASHVIGTDAGIDGIKSGFMTTSQPNEMLFAYALSGIATLGSGFTQRSDFHGDVVEDRIVATPNDVQAIATMTAGSDWTILASTYKAR